MDLIQRPDVQRVALIHPTRMAIESLYPALTHQVIDPPGYLYVSVDCGWRPMTLDFKRPVWRALFRNDGLPVDSLRAATLSALTGAGDPALGDRGTRGQLGYITLRPLSDDELDMLEPEFRVLRDMRVAPATDRWDLRNEILKHFPIGLKDFAMRSLAIEYGSGSKQVLHIPEGA